MRRAIIALALLLVGAAADDDDFDRAARALAAGASAAASGHRIPLRAAALALQASRARPVAGPDLATQWLRAARAPAPPVERDRALGPGYRTLRLGAGGAATFEQTFLAGQLARVAVIPLHRSDFLIRVSDEGAKLLCAIGPARGRCEWVPSYTTRFTIEILNPARSSGQYLVVMQ